MITIYGSIQRSFVFPANLKTAFEYYSDIRRTFSFLAHIYLVQHFGGLQYRLAYNTTELGIYRVRLMCDIETELDHQNGILRISPLEEMTPVPMEAGVNSLIAQGFYTSESVFHHTGNQTEIDYTLKIHARLPVPYGIRFMPDTVLSKIANNITHWRMEEIAEGFIERSVQFYLAHHG